MIDFRYAYLRVGSCIQRGSWMLLLLLLTGCSSKGTITGKITYQGKPLPVGTVTFVPEQGGSFISDIRDGEYKVMKVPSGPVKIAIATPSQSPPAQYIEQMRPPAELLEKMVPGKAGEGSDKPFQERKPVSIPKRFSDPTTSGLTYTVKSGPQVFDIDLPDK
jgi:hypothetical protein